MEDGEEVKKRSRVKDDSQKISARVAGDLLGFKNNKMFAVKLKFGKVESKTFAEWKKLFEDERLLVEK